MRGLRGGSTYEVIKVWASQARDQVKMEMTEG